MGTINLLLTAFVVALAPLLGLFLGWFAREELKPGRRFLIGMQHVLFFAIAALFLSIHKWLFASLVIGLVFLFAYLTIKLLRELWIVMPLLAIAFALTTITPWFFVMSVLVFLHGLPTGSLLMLQKQRWQKVAGLSVIFFFVSAGIFLL